MTLRIGAKAPDFKATDQANRTQQLSDYAGSWVLLYFYPKDDTPGCTTEACSFRDSYAVYKKAGIAVLGVSGDSVKSHEKFVSKYKLPFPLLADESKKLLTLYGAWKKKTMWGKTFLGIHRMSYLIDPQGKIAKIYERVKPEDHAAEVLADVQQHLNI